MRSRAGPAPKAPPNAQKIGLSLLVHRSGGDHLHGAVHRADDRVVLFQHIYWDPFEARWAGWDNYVQFFSEPFLVRGVANTLIFAVVTSGLETVLDLLLAVLLTSGIFGQSFLRSVVFFPVLVSTIGVGILFKELMHPTDGAINMALAAIGIDGPGCLTRSGR